MKQLLAILILFPSFVYSASTLSKENNSLKISTTNQSYSLYEDCTSDQLLPPFRFVLMKKGESDEKCQNNDWTIVHKDESSVSEMSLPLPYEKGTYKILTYFLSKKWCKKQERYIGVYVAEYSNEIILEQSDNPNNQVKIEDFDIYPNPVIDQIFINSKRQFHNVNIEVLNSTSQKVYSRFHNLNANQPISINPQASPGIYFLKINSSQATFSRKIIIQ